MTSTDSAAPTPHYNILVASMTGTAEFVAEEIGFALEQGGATISQMDMYDLTSAVFAKPGRFIICSSTYGSGDIPDNAQAFFDSVANEKPDLSHVEYAVFALGDRGYRDTFCFGGRRFDALLASLGATRVLDTYLHDASGDTLPEVDCLDWIKPLLSSAAARI